MHAGSPLPSCRILAPDMSPPHASPSMQGHSQYRHISMHSYLVEGHTMLPMLSPRIPCCLLNLPSCCTDALIRRAQNLLVQYKEMDIPQDRVLLRIPGLPSAAFSLEATALSRHCQNLALCNLISQTSQAVLICDHT